MTLQFLNPALASPRKGRSGLSGPTLQRNLRWVDNFECLALNGVDEFVIDEQTGSVKDKQIARRRGREVPVGTYGC